MYIYICVCVCKIMAWCVVRLRTEERFPDMKGKKGKAIPLHAWTGPEGSRKLRLPDFKTIGT